MILLDTNILVFSKQVINPKHTAVTQKLIQLVQNGETLCICPQVLYEFYVVATRPAASRGLGLTHQQALAEIVNLQSAYTFINDPADLFVQWHQLIQQFGTAGNQAHDARIVAFMRSHGIDSIYTDNVKDFAPYSSIINIIT